MADGGQASGGSGENGVVAGSPADLFETEDAERLRLGEVPMPFGAMGARPGPGRPKGSGNRRTVAMRDTFLRLYRHPMIWMGEVMAQTPAELAKALECKPFEALEIQRKVAADLMPYLESKMPVEVRGAEGDRVPLLVVGEIGGILRAARQARPDGAMAIDDDVLGALEIHEQDQRAARDGAAKSHGYESHGDGQEPDDAAQSSEPAAD